MRKALAILALSIAPVLAGAVEQASYIFSGGYANSRFWQYCFTNEVLCQITDASKQIVAPLGFVSRYDGDLSKPMEYTFEDANVPSGLVFEKWVLLRMPSDNVTSLSAFPATLSVAAANHNYKIYYQYTDTTASIPRGGINCDTYMLIAPCFKWLEYGIVYWANDGSDTYRRDPNFYADQIYTNAVTVMDGTWTRAGCSFLGWSTDASATEAAFLPGEVKTGADFGATTNGVNLYAVWKPVYHTVSVLSQHETRGSVEPAGETNLLEGAELTFSATPYSGYRFTGWSDGSAERSRTVTVTTDMVFKASFALNAGAVTNTFEEVEIPQSDKSFTAYYLPNGGSGEMAPRAVADAAEAIAVSNEFTRSGYEYAGWATNSISDGHIALEATWEEKGLVLVSDGAWTFTNGAWRAASMNAKLSAAIQGQGTLSFSWYAAESSSGGVGSSGLFASLTATNSAGEAVADVKPLAEAGKWTAVEVEVTNELETAFTWETKLFRAVTVSNVVWTAKASGETEASVAYLNLRTPFVADGTVKTGVVAVAGCTLTGTASATAAGEYVATATLALDAGYAWPDGGTAASNVTWKIVKDVYDLSGVSLPNATYTVDGTAKSLAISGTLPDGVSVDYSNNGQTDAGAYIVTASFTGDEWHEAIPPLSALLILKPEGAKDEFSGMAISIR